MKRQAIARGTVWRKARPIVRPGVTPPMPKGWPKIARGIRRRDLDHCRRCGRHALSGAVDHLVPRRLLVRAETATSTNLALLCVGPGSCHAFKTMVLEPKLYRGDVLAFDLFLASIAHSGPIPSTALKARAYARLRRLLYGAPSAS